MPHEPDVSESLQPPDPGEAARLIGAALVGEAPALMAFLETHVSPLRSASVPVSVEGPGGTPLLSVRVEVRRGAEGAPYAVLVVG